MVNLIEKKFINPELKIEFNSYVDEECCIWFHGKEVAQILGYQKPCNAIEKHVSKKYKKGSPIQGPLGGEQKCVIINEYGFYELVFKSRLLKAKMFREWVFSEVLPSIRKYGYFNMFQSKRKRRVIFEGKKYHKHPVFNNYAASKNGDVLSLKTKRIIRMNKCGSGYLKFTRHIYNIDSFLKCLMEKFLLILKLIILIILKRIIELKTNNYFLANKIMRNHIINQ